MIIRRMGHRAAAALISCVSIFAAGYAHAGQDGLDKARALYAAAEYDEALAVLDRLRTTVPREAIEIAAFRVFCLLALERTDAASREIEVMLKLDPRYRPSDTETSPRVRAVFDDVRVRMLPRMIRASYARGKSAFDRHDLPVALVEFERVLSLLDEAVVTDDPALEDLRTLATGFRDLSRTLHAHGAATGTNGSAARTRPYEANDAAVVRPVPVSQTLPPWHPRNASDLQQEYRGTLELIIDETGGVLVAALQHGIHPAYDAALLEAARHWKYRPAMKDGSPVKYRELMTIRLRPYS